MNNFIGSLGALSFHLRLEGLNQMGKGGGVEIFDTFLGEQQGFLYWGGIGESLPH